MANGGIGAAIINNIFTQSLTRCVPWSETFVKKKKKTCGNNFREILILIAHMVRWYKGLTSRCKKVGTHTDRQSGMDDDVRNGIAR